MYAELGLALRHLLDLRQKAIELEAPWYIREAEALLNRLHPEWRRYIKEPKKIEFQEPLQPKIIPPAVSAGFDFIAQANANDQWLDRR